MQNETAENSPEFSITSPSPGFEFSVKFSVSIKGTPDQLWYYLGDMEKMSDFFPSLSFRREQTGPLAVGEIYYSKLSAQKNWTGYEVLIADENKRLSARQIGSYLFVKEMQYDHKLIPDGQNTISFEKIDYNLSAGIFNPLLNWAIARAIIKKTTLAAHHELKNRVENQGPWSPPGQDEANAK